MKNVITVSEELINEIDKVEGKKNDFEQLIEQLLRKYLDEIRKKQQDMKDLQILNQNSVFLNNEAEDVLDFQVNL